MFCWMVENPRITANNKIIGTGLYEIHNKIILYPMFYNKLLTLKLCLLGNKTFCFSQVG